MAYFGATVVILSLLGARFWYSTRSPIRASQAVTKSDASEPIGKKYPFEVAGPSMVPTLHGPSRQMQCMICETLVRVTPNRSELLDRHRVCSLCGGQLKPAGLAHNRDTDNSESSATLDADVVSIRPLHTSQRRQLRIGDVVAIDRGGILRVKRIAALPGDTIAIADQRIWVNGRRLEDTIAAETHPLSLPPSILAVDRDSRRQTSRWQTTTNETTWQRESNKHWTYQPDANDAGTWSQWLVYHHQNVYAKNRPSEVLDDYSFNLGLTRRLNVADRLVLTVDVLVPQSVSVEVAFWSTSGVAIANRNSMAAGETRFRFHDAMPIDPNEPIKPPVDAKSPLAIRFQTTADHVELKDISVDRLIQYRLRPTDDESRYPLHLQHQQAFFVGDNVPVSDDSRNWGPIPLNSVVGKVISVIAR